jgi:hypothetical protein
VDAGPDRAGDDDRDRRRERVDRGDVQRREPGAAGSAVEVRRARRRARQPPARAGRRRARGGTGQLGRHRRRQRRRLDGDARQAAGCRPGCGRAPVRLPLGEPGRRSGRRPARRQHPRRLLLPDRRGRPLVRAGRRRRVDRRRGGRRRRSGDDAEVQPGPDRSGERGVGRQPQAARRPVPVRRALRLRDREPLRLEARRRPALGAEPAAGERVRDAAAPAGTRGRRLRFEPAHSRSAGERDRARRPERLPVLRHGLDSRGQRATRPDRRAAARGAVHSTCSTATRRRSTTC